jgi:hypothetical protein
VAKKPTKAKKGTEKTVKTEARKEESPKAETAPDQQAESTPAPKKIELNAPGVQEAIKQGQTVIKDGKSKADAARVIYDKLKSEDKDLVVAAFVAGAGLTPKGAVTYWYNVKRKVEKEAKKAASG